MARRSLWCCRWLVRCTALGRGVPHGFPKHHRDVCLTLLARPMVTTSLKPLAPCRPMPMYTSSSNPVPSVLAGGPQSRYTVKRDLRIGCPKMRVRHFATQPNAWHWPRAHDEESDQARPQCDCSGRGERPGAKGSCAYAMVRTAWLKLTLHGCTMCNLSHRVRRKVSRMGFAVPSFRGRTTF